MAVYGEQAQRIRAIAFVKEKAVNGLTHREIADKYNVDERTVSRVLTWAERAKIFVEIEDQLIQEMAPLAVEAIRTAMTQTDNPEVAAKTALEVLKGLNIIKKTHAITTKEVKDQDDLAKYIATLRDDATDAARTVDGTVLGEQKALNPAPEPDSDESEENVQ